MTARKLPGDFTGSLMIEHCLAPFGVRDVTVVNEGQEVGRHTHEQAHFMLVLAGQYLRYEGAKVEVVRPPFLLFDPAGTTHDDCFARSEGRFVSLLMLGGMDALVPGEPRSLRRPEAIRAALGLARQARWTIADLVALEGAAWEVIAEIEEVSGTIHSPRWAHDAYDRVMDEAGDAKLSISTIAARSNVHPVHLARVFRQTWGLAPAELLRWRRVERAAELLEKRDMPAAEIAASVGFCDQSHMNRAFKAHFGVPPSQWQRAAMLRKSKTVKL
jgi:AraC family transcriptional regulator